MSNEVLTAWQAGYQGQGTRVFVVDDYTSATRLTGNLGQGLISQQHGWWTSSQVKAIAPLATVDTISWANAAPLPIASTPGLKIVNMSYAVYAVPSSSITWDPLQSSIIKAANAGQIVAVKAAGNDGIAVNATNVSGLKDFMNAALFNAPSLILAGALNANGSPTAQTTRASYSNYAGSDPAAQARFLFVGVPGDATKLYGTSFAAPVISGYASVLGSKFTSGTATQIANQLLATARTDTIKDYSASVYGRGEASLSRALAPASIH
jgi:subtilisin family serine protease